MKKYFTVEEAHAILPIIREEVGQLQAIKRAFEKRYEELSLLKQKLATPVKERDDRLFEREFELEFMQIEAQTIVNSIAQKGAELKSVEAGLVDFPALKDGQEILLCWKMGEERITHYHGPEEGFIGRKPLDGEVK
ncbi:DUF2203 domain-containing protein [Paenibacillus senegalensis]|uniref:DUF2203 domain-containing protein n=1 Tax=Paenibacillus senegalensis TaxID=1465766 RepID=UPI000288DD7F|nr:DUF2203 domain-containing protein [Paenibacillus senegalensis]